MPIEETVQAVAAAATWEARVALIRQIPEYFGKAQHQDVYAAIAAAVYVPKLAPDFAYIHWSEDYEVGPTHEAYIRAEQLTAGFTQVDEGHLTAAIQDSPETLRVFRLLLGFTTQEFAASTERFAGELNHQSLSNSRIKSIEGGTATAETPARMCARVIDRAMRGELFPSPATPELQHKIRKPDTMNGWDTVRQYAANGVPLYLFLHQRHYGGAFRQLLDATSTKRGDILEDAVELLFQQRHVSFVRTGSANQGEIAERFNVTVHPAPDFVVYSGNDVLRALLECKGANDGGTARDKAARFGVLRTESQRLGGVPVFAVLAGLGWKRTADALGPVIRDTDGRTFTLPTLEEMLTVQPFPDLVS